MEDIYKFYILKKPIDNESLKTSELPVIVKINNKLLGVNFKLINAKEAEGSFSSKYELQCHSTIFSKIRLQKHKERVLKNKNVKEIKDLIFTPKGNTYEKSFMAALHHTIVGKISRKKVSGVHFYNPENVKINKVIQTNNQGVYSAIIEKLHPVTKQWVKKDEVTNFFPKNWSINKLFHECSYAYFNRKHVSGKIYKSSTPSGIQVKFIINNKGKILTFYPIIKAL